MNAATLESIPSGETFASLDVLRRQHSVMLSQRREASSDKKTAHSPEQILSFLGQVKATGRILPDPDSRDAAQSVLDYWSAVLLTSRPELSDKLGALFPDECDSAAALAANITLHDKTSATDETPWEEKARLFTDALSSEDDETLRRLLPKLVRFSIGTDEFYLHAMPVASAGDQDPGEQKLLQRMLEKGLVHEEGESSAASYVLADISLIKDWRELRELCSQRRTFRGQARRWHNASRAKSLLLDSVPQLASASSYRDMIEYETAYLDISRSESDGKNSRAKWALTIGLAIVSALAMACIAVTLYLIDANKKLTVAIKAKENADIATAKATDAVESTQFELAQTKINNEVTLNEIRDQVTVVKDEISRTPAGTDTVTKLNEIVATIQTGETLPTPTNAPETSSQANPAPSDAPWLIHPSLTQTASEATEKDGWQSGKVHIFGIDSDTRIKPTDTLAIIARWSEADALVPPIFKANVDRGPKPLVIQLDANALILAARWDYKITPRRWLLQNKIPVRNPRTGKVIEAQAVDWGPSAKEGHLMDLSPGLATALGLTQNDKAEIKVPTSPQVAK